MYLMGSIVFKPVFVQHERAADLHGTKCQRSFQDQRLRKQRAASKQALRPFSAQQSDTDMLLYRSLLRGSTVTDDVFQFWKHLQISIQTYFLNI